MYCVIVGNSPSFDAEYFETALRDCDLLLAADGGANACRRVAVVPQLVVGDLDSLEQYTLDWLKACSATILQLPREKDETDLEMAIRIAIERGAQTIDILGATEGRLDHTLANIFMLAMEELVGKQVRLVDFHYDLLLVRAGEQCTIKGLVNETVSLLPLSPVVKGVTIEGFYYPLADATLYAHRARGVSNILRQPEGHITVREGMLLVVHHADYGKYQWKTYAASKTS